MSFRSFSVTASRSPQQYARSKDKRDSGEDEDQADGDEVDLIPGKCACAKEKLG